MLVLPNNKQTAYKDIKQKTLLIDKKIEIITQCVL
jgi:hypothetical protein